MVAKKDTSAKKPQPQTREEKRAYADMKERARSWHCSFHKIDTFKDFKDYMVELMNAVRIGEVDRSAANSNAYMGSLILMALERMHKYGETQEAIAHFLAESGLTIEMSPEEAAILLKETNQNTQVRIIQEVLKRRQEAQAAIDVHPVETATQQSGNLEYDMKKLLQMSTEFRAVGEDESTAPAAVLDDDDEIPF